MAEGITQDRIRIAAAQYPIELLPSFEAWEAKLARWVEEAVVRGADCLVFPEYAAMELAGTDPAAAGDLAASLELVIALGEAYDAACRALAVKHGIVLLGGSRPFRRDDGIVVNRARLHTPDGGGGYQDKIVMTRFERELWGVSGGDTIQVIDTPAGLVGIAICFDVEFPLIARAQAEAGARLILAPSATDTMQGFWRVRIGAQARALENQCFVVQASTVGLADWLPRWTRTKVRPGSSARPTATLPTTASLPAASLRSLAGPTPISTSAKWRRGVRVGACSTSRSGPSRRLRCRRAMPLRPWGRFSSRSPNPMRAWPTKWRRGSASPCRSPACRASRRTRGCCRSIQIR
ncbi:carbon-nitrogen hydrolase family protein [Novosphingobium sp. NBM11]|uniref:carbon-nitrogen hydrolase family protein n=1 Tax=Novosphingobium sp. NBM11 TaxID=2596914 RepID=UPI00210668B4|nr:carbon-nitrogen hydrolase family protein [Novosphingobium sp. NBM11]